MNIKLFNTSALPSDTTMGTQDFNTIMNATTTTCAKTVDEDETVMDQIVATVEEEEIVMDQTLNLEQLADVRHIEVQIDVHQPIALRTRSRELEDFPVIGNRNLPSTLKTSAVYCS